MDKVFPEIPGLFTGIGSKLLISPVSWRVFVTVTANKIFFHRTSFQNLALKNKKNTTRQIIKSMASFISILLS